MGILSSIFQKIFPPSHPAVAQDTAASGASIQQSTAGAVQLDPASAGTPATVPAPSASMPVVDVEEILDGMPASDTLNWRTSIVDLLKLLDLDSSFQSRTALAHELGFTGNTADSATMNIWLHKQVMSKLAQNGGKLPANLL